MTMPAIPPPDKELVQYVRKQGMPHELVSVLQSIGYFSAKSSPLTPRCTTDEIHEYVNMFETGSRMLLNAPSVLSFSDEMLQNVNEEKFVITGVDGNKINIYINKPKESNPTQAILYIHGGAMAVMGTQEGAYRAWCRILAKQGFLIAAVEFRNSSGSGVRSPFPGGLNDCVSALKWLVDQDDITEVTVCGESGGANLTITTCVRAAKKFITKGKLTGAIALDPYIGGPAVWSDWKTSEFRSLSENDGIGGLSNDWLYMGMTYTPNKVDWENGEAWPLFLTDEEIELLPPVSLQTSDLDTLRDEGMAFSKRLAEKGKLVTHAHQIGHTHTMHLLPFHPALMRLTDMAAMSVAAFAMRRK